MTDRAGRPGHKTRASSGNPLRIRVSQQAGRQRLPSLPYIRLNCATGRPAASRRVRLEPARLKVRAPARAMKNFCS